MKPGSDLGTNYLQNGKWYQQTTMYPYATFSSLQNSRSLIESVLDTNRARCSVGPDLGTNYLQSILSDSLGPVVNILTIFSNAYILKKYIKGIRCPLLIDQVMEK